MTIAESLAAWWPHTGWEWALITACVGGEVVAIAALGGLVWFLDRHQRGV